MTRAKTPKPITATPSRTLARGHANSLFPELCSHHRRYRHLVAQMSPYPCMNRAGRCNCTIIKKMLLDPLVDTEGTPDD